MVQEETGEGRDGLCASRDGGYEAPVGYTDWAMVEVGRDTRDGG